MYTPSPGARILCSCLRNHVRRKLTLVLIIYVAIGLIFVPFICQCLPYSWYYLADSHQDYKIILAENNKRVEAANALLSSLNHTTVYNNISSPYRTTKAPDFCFVINTISRPVATSCLTQVVSILLPQILNDEGTVLVLNNAEGKTHKEAISLSRIVPVISNKKHGNLLRSSFDKERQDYLFALRWCSRRKAKFTVVFEDDALPSADFLSRLRFILKRRMNADEKNWAFLKLFYPEKYQGWGNEVHLIAELLGLSVAGGLVLTMLVYCGESLAGGSKQSSWLLLIVCSIFFTVYILLSTGRPHWLALRKVSVHFSSVVSGPGCCTQATLFPNSHLDGLIEFLEAVQCNQLFPIDLALDKFADDRGFQKLLVIPNLIKHIGFVSSLPGKGWKNSKEFLVR